MTIDEELYRQNQMYQTALRTIVHSLGYIIEEARAQRAPHLVGLLTTLREQILYPDPFYSSVTQSDIERTKDALRQLKEGSTPQTNVPRYRIYTKEDPHGQGPIQD